MLGGECLLGTRSSTGIKTSHGMSEVEWGDVFFFCWTRAKHLNRDLIWDVEVEWEDVFLLDKS